MDIWWDEGIVLLVDVLAVGLQHHDVQQILTSVPQPPRDLGIGDAKQRTSDSTALDDELIALLALDDHHIDGRPALARRYRGRTWQGDTSGLHCCGVRAGAGPAD